VRLRTEVLRQRDREWMMVGLDQVERGRELPQPEFCCRNTSGFFPLGLKYRRWKTDTSQQYIILPMFL
jgi:hypothetical protein